jgi:hypothetical protein
MNYTRFSSMSAPGKISYPALLLRYDPGIRQQKNSENKSQHQKAGRDDPALLCRQCLSFITRPGYRIVINGTHHHTFANPYGIVFEIGCFKEAGGCAAAGAPSSEFTWFPGFKWQIALCASCMTHLGWRFVSAGSGIFYGLILDQLIESS